jgi:L-fucose isomerase
MCRLNLVDPLGPVLQIAEGTVLSVDGAIHSAIDDRTNPTWPTTYFEPRLTGSAPFESVYDVMLHWGANHGAICFGHIGADLMTLASMLRIPVCMSNVAPRDVFRPNAWYRFGSSDPQGADYRACQSFGPLYA